MMALTCVAPNGALVYCSDLHPTTVSWNTARYSNSLRSPEFAGVLTAAKQYVNNEDNEVMSDFLTRSLWHSYSFHRQTQSYLFPHVVF